VSPQPPAERRPRRKPDRYHHGDLKAALIDTAVDLIAERGVRAFSLAEASRRLGVAASAPYAHFADREALLGAVAVRACQTFLAELEPRVSRLGAPADRLAEMARVYVRFAAAHRPLFETLFEAGLDKGRYPEISAAEKAIEDVYATCIGDLSPENASAEALAAAVEAAAHGHALLMLDGRFGEGRRAIAVAAESAARATLAIIESRRLLDPREDGSQSRGTVRAPFTRRSRRRGAGSSS
jgi:AcrR family transcriptional regulator